MSYLSAGELISLAVKWSCEGEDPLRYRAAVRSIENISRLQSEALQWGDKGEGNRNDGFIWVRVVGLQWCCD